MLYLENKRSSKTFLDQKFPRALFIDVTSKSKDDFIKFSPFFPHGEIPVPYSNIMSFSVEGIWQGLKVFENADIDCSKFLIKNMKNIKRGATKFGNILGHRKGIYSNEILGYLTARKSIYLPAYEFVLNNYLLKEVEVIKKISKDRDIVFLDYNTNSDIENLTKPLSHASLIIKYIKKQEGEK